MQQRVRQKNTSTIPPWIVAIICCVSGLLGLLALDSAWQRFLWACFLIILYAASLGFWLMFIPGKGKTRLHQIAALATHVFHRRTIFTILKGRCDQDYFALQRKPFFPCVYIDQFSAAAIREKSGRLKILRAGFHFLHRGDEIMHTFDLRPGMIILDPDTTENPFQILVRHDGTLARMNALTQDIEKTKYTAADGQVFCPVFAIFYQLRHKEDQEKSGQGLRAISAEFIRIGQTGLALDQFEKMIGSLAVRSFRSIMDGKSSVPAGDTQARIEDMRAAFQRQSDQGKIDGSMRELANSKAEHAILDAYNLRVDLLQVWAK